MPSEGIIIYDDDDDNDNMMMTMTIMTMARITMMMMMIEMDLEQSFTNSQFSNTHITSSSAKQESQKYDLV